LGIALGRVADLFPKDLGFLGTWGELKRSEHLLFGAGAAFVVGGELGQGFSFELGALAGSGEGSSRFDGSARGGRLAPEHPAGDPEYGNQSDDDNGSKRAEPDTWRRVFKIGFQPAGNGDRS